MKSQFAFVWDSTTLHAYSSVRFLIFIRYVLVGIALLALAFWHQWVEPFNLWLNICVIMVGLFSWSQVVLWKKSLQLSSNAALRELILDLIWIVSVIVITGGAANPFIYYLWVVIALAATLLSLQQAWLMCGLSIVCYSVILFMDVQSHFHHFTTDYRVHLIGMWLNYLFSTVITCFIVTTLMKALRDQHKKMLSYRENTLKNEQIIGLATVATTTVHNLATPLATLRLLIDDLDIEQNLKPQDHQDLLLMREQVYRCQDTIKALSTMAQKNDDQTPIQVTSFVQSLMDHYALNSPKSQPEITASALGSICIASNALFQHAVINLINNAIESSCDKTQVNIAIHNKTLLIEITNTTNNTEDMLLSHWGKVGDSMKETGLGIGSLLANSTIERQGGTVSLTTIENPKQAETLSVAVVIRFPVLMTEDAVI